jgi:hypothetical protein
VSLTMRHRLVALTVTLAVAAVVVALYFAGAQDSVAGTNWDTVLADHSWL